MQKPFFLLLLALALALPACRPKPEILSPTASPTPMLTPTAAPSPTPTDLPTATATPAPTDTPVPTDTPQPAAAPAPDCFVSGGVAFAFLPDHQTLLFKSETGIQSVDLQTKQSQAFLPLPPGPELLAAPAALSPQGDRLAVALADNSIRVYSTATKKLLHAMTAHTAPVTELEFSPDGQKLYSASHDTWVRAWDRAGKPLGAFQPAGADGFPGEVLGLGLSPDGKLLATIPFDGKTKLWDAQTFALVRELGASGGYDNSDALFSPDGQYLAAITANGLFLWRVADGAQLLGGNPGINAMAFTFSPDGRSLVYWEMGGNNEITFLSADGSKTLRVLKTGEAPIWFLFFSPDGSLLAAASNLGTQIWAMPDGVLRYAGKPECP